LNEHLLFIAYDELSK
jgi:Domain of unknown function (DUF4440)